MREAGMIGRGRRMWARLPCVAALLLGLGAVTASAQIATQQDRCAENREAIALLEAQRANGGRLDNSLARRELAAMRGHYQRIEQIEALRATERLVGGFDTDESDRLVEAEKRAIAASARKYGIQCMSFYSDGFAADCIGDFERMVRAAEAAPPPDPRQVEQLLAAYRSNLAALRCDESRQAAAPAATRGCQGFTGKWNTNYGPMWLVENGGSITGFYDWVGSAGPRHDTLSGTVTGNVAEGQYSQPGYPNPDYQSGRFRFERSGTSFSGAGWSKSGGSSLAWSGTCAAP
jgi:hypothetical protein